MKKEEYLKHLDRAFTEMPPELSNQIELTFRRGAKAVNQRQKIMTALSVAAVIAVLCAALALAAGTLVKPRVDNVVAARGSGAGTGEGGASSMERSASEPTIVPNWDSKATPVPEITSSDGEVLQGEVVQPLNAEDAIEWVKQLDEKAADATGFWVYLSTESNGAWVFYATGYDSGTALFQGGAWYLGQDCLCLGHSEAVLSWYFIAPTEAKGSEYRGAAESYALDGEHVAYDGELFASVIQTDGGNQLHVWKIGENGTAVEVDAGDKLCGLSTSGGLLRGVTAEDPGDLCFLRERDGQLYQACGQLEEVSEVEKLPGGAALLEELKDMGYAVTGCLYRSMGADTEAEVIAVNLEQDGAAYHTYLYRESWADELDCGRGWEGDMEVLTGAASFVVDAGLPRVTSGGIEVTHADKDRQAEGARAQKQPTFATPEPTPTPQPLENDALTIVYTQPNSNYYHSAPDCSGMEGAIEWTLASAVSVGKQPCPVCIGMQAEVTPEPTPTPRPKAMSRNTPVPVQEGASEIALDGEAYAASDAVGYDLKSVFYATLEGHYYHEDRNCSGMKGALPWSFGALWFDGKQPCPVCVGQFEAPDFMVYATPKGKYYHVYRDCSGMKNAYALSEAYAREKGKQACPVCISGGDALCWATPEGTYYHSERECMGMHNARIYTERMMEQQGRQPCPVCWADGTSTAYIEVDRG